MGHLPDWAKIAILVFLTVFCLIPTCSLIIVGYVVPASQNDGYVLQTCKCGKSYINNNPISVKISSKDTTYLGTVDLTYSLANPGFTRNVPVLTSQSYVTVKTYLSVNYPINATVVCYVLLSAKDIRISPFSSYLALGFCIAFLILSNILFIVSCVCCCRVRKRRAEYLELVERNI